MKENELIDLYRRQMANKKAAAPEGLWNDIARKLVVEEAWAGISDQLDKDTQKKGFWYVGRRAAAVAALISFGALSVWLLNRDVSESRMAEQTEISVPSLSDSESTESADEQQPLSGEALSQSPVLAALPVTVEYEQAGIRSYKETEGIITPQQTSSAVEQFAPALPGLTVAPKPLPIQTSTYGDAYSVLQAAGKTPTLIDVDDLNVFDGTLADASSNNKNPFSSFSLGITTAIKNTWLINNETVEGFNRLNHNRTDLKFYPDIGINLHYQHNSRWGLETGLFFSSSTGQAYRHYIHGKYSHRTISLNYMQWELMASHTSGTRMFRNPNAVSLKSVLGFYASAMNSATEIIGNDQFDVKSLYSGFDYGIVMGQYLQWNPARRIVFAPGIHVKWGLTDIYRGGTHLPLNFSNTYNRSIEFRLNFYYSLGQ